MVYENETLELCHDLTEEGKVQYNRLLEEKADEILFRHEHPIKWFFGKFAG